MLGLYCRLTSLQPRTAEGGGDQLAGSHGFVVEKRRFLRRSLVSVSMLYCVTRSRNPMFSSLRERGSPALFRGVFVGKPRSC